MFNVVRDIEAPECLSRKIYNDASVVKALEEIFYGKCYLCEQDELSDAEIEHFIPHGSVDELKYKWENLFLSCSRCNNIKSDSHLNLLDCSDESVSVFEEIIHLAGNCSSGVIDIRVAKENPGEKALNTAALLNECFNSSNTGLRKISKESLMEKLQGEFFYYMSYRMQLVDKRSSSEVIQNAKNKLKPMCRVSYPFSAFWRWHILTDQKIIKFFPNIRAELEF